MNRAILGEGGTVMQFVGDAVMAVFGAPFPQPDHPDRAVAAAAGMHALQAEINTAWAAEGLHEFGLGIGLSTGQVAAALLGSEERLEYGGWRDCAVRANPPRPDRTVGRDRAASPAGEGPRYADPRLQACPERHPRRCRAHEPMTAHTTRGGR